MPRKRRNDQEQGPAGVLGPGPYRADPTRGKPTRHRLAAAARRFLLSLAASVAPPVAVAAPNATVCQAPDAPAGPRLRVAVSGARSAVGNVTVTLYGPRREDFLARGGRLARQRVPLAGATTAEACFALPAPGEYAVAVYHDENDDHDFNRNAVGLPVEGYGFSNDAPTTFGLPDFDRVRFTLPAAGGGIAVRLRY
jgi:uncharacterized protein (DUF2141 family)